MLIISVRGCPPGLRGELSRWMVEVDTGLFVGKSSQRVRELIWERVERSSVSHAAMIYSARNEQGYDIRVLGDSISVVDLDGLKLMRTAIFPNKGANQESHPKYTKGQALGDENETISFFYFDDNNVHFAMDSGQ